MSTERYEKGMQVMSDHLTAKAAINHIQAIEEVAPNFARVNVEFAFGDLYSSTVVDAKTRELCTVAALTVQGVSLLELKLHIHAALHCGATQAEIVEIITQMLAYCGFPAATNAILTAKEVFKNYAQEK